MTSPFSCVFSPEFLRGHFLSAAAVGGRQSFTNLQPPWRVSARRRRGAGFWRAATLHPPGRPSDQPQPGGLLSSLCGNQVLCRVIALCFSSDNWHQTFCHVGSSNVSVPVTRAANQSLSCVACDRVQ